MLRFRLNSTPKPYTLNPSLHPNSQASAAACRLAARRLAPLLFLFLFLFLFPLTAGSCLRWMMTCVFCL